MLDVEPRIEIAGQDAGAEVVQRFAAGRSGRDALEDGLQVQSRLVTVEQRLAETDHRG
jgi:hypothetical protein